MGDYAIVQSGGKQYRLSPGDRVRVEALGAVEDETVEFKDVLMVSKDGKVEMGSPFVEGVAVRAKVLGNGRGKKVVVFKYKNKTRYRRKAGHRQSFTELVVSEILE